MRLELKETAIAWLTFLASSTTLLCCTIPIILVAVGLGAVLAAWIPHLGWWITLSEYKFILFIVSGIFLVFTYLFFQNASSICPTDPEMAAKCQTLRKWNWRLLILSIFIWITGFVLAYSFPVLTAKG